jgi:hypothetical protein
MLRSMLHARAVVFAGALSVTWCGCSRDSTYSTFSPLDPGVPVTADCVPSPTTGACPCKPLADFVSPYAASVSTLADIDDASAWGKVPDCAFLQSTNACLKQIEVLPYGFANPPEIPYLFYDQTTGALTGVKQPNSDYTFTCYGTDPADMPDTPGGDCDGIWNLEPRFGVPHGVCYVADVDADTPDVDAGIADAGSD